MSGASELVERWPEAHDVVLLANRILDEPGRDPDDDLSMLARQFLRAREEAERLSSAHSEAVEDARWQRLRDLFGMDGWYDGLWQGIPTPDQIVTHIEHVANERARLLHEASASRADVAALREALAEAARRFEGLSHIHDGNPSDAMADMPPLDYARHMLWEARRECRDAAREARAALAGEKPVGAGVETASDELLDNLASTYPGDPDGSIRAALSKSGEKPTATRKGGG